MENSDWSEGHPWVGVLPEPDGGDVPEHGRAVVHILQAEADLAAGGLGRLSLSLDGNHRHLEFSALSLPVQLPGSPHISRLARARPDARHKEPLLGRGDEGPRGVRL